MTNKFFSIVGWIGTVLVVLAVGLRYLKPEFDLWAVRFAWGGLVCVILYALSQWRELFGAFQQRNTRYGTLAGISVIVVLFLLVGINYLAARENKRWDLTVNKEFSLSDQTVKLLKGVDSPVKFLVFDQEANFDRFRNRLTEYQYQSPKVSVEYIDVDKKPTVARQYQVQSYGTVVIQYKGRTERVSSDSEQDLTNGLIKAITGKQKKVYFLSGHGERDTSSSDRTGYSAIVQSLGRDNYTVDKLILAQQQDVPADASVVVVAGPKNDLLTPEVDALKRYLAKGGKLLVMVDPPDRDDAPALTNLQALLRDWDIEIGNNVVVDVSGMGQLIGTDASVPVAASYPSHPITEKFTFLTAFPLTRSVSAVAGGVNGHYAQPFVQTSERSWAETDIKQLMSTGKVAMEPDKGDKPGPVSIAAATAATAAAAPEPAAKPGDPAPPKPETRVAVMGDSDFASNAWLGMQGNRDLLMNTVNWLAQNESLIAIRPRETGDRRVTLTSRQQSGVFWMALLLIPACVFGAGVYTWWRRR